MERRIVTNQEAKKLGLKRFFTGRACSRGHISERITSSGNCVDCRNAYMLDYGKSYYEKHKEKVLERSRRRYINKKEYIKNRLLSNPELMHRRKKWNAEYRKKNSIGFAKRSKEWRQNNRGRFKDAIKRWQKNNRAKMRAYAAKWENKNPERAKARFVRYEARLRGADGDHTGEDIKRIYKMQRGKCAYCRKALSGKWQVDHIIPLLNGGTNDARNIQLLCYTKTGCNQSKGSKDPLDFARSLGLLL
jgi:5-methylcytosine-specific restriction endonuclease McrA